LQSIARATAATASQKTLTDSPIKSQTQQENMQGFYMRSTCSEVLLVLRRRMRDDQVAYQLLGLGLDFKTQSFLSIHAKAPQ